MTEIIQLTGDKPEFFNYINDTMIIKENSKVCLNKASFSIPVMVNRNIFAPFGLLAADYDDTFFNVSINGVENNITFREFYTAYIAIDDLSDPTIDRFYSGSYNIWCDNLPQLISDAPTVYEIPTFTDILAKACRTSFSYYDFYVENKVEMSALGGSINDAVFTINGINILYSSDLRNIKKYGVSAMYSPIKVTNLTASSIAWAASNVNNFNVAGDRIESADANPAMAVAPNLFDRNGGWIAATPGLGAGKMCMGLVFMGSGQNDPLNITGVYQPENFDVGIEWELLGSGDRVLQIIDGNQKFVYYDSTANAEVTTIKPNYVPPNQIFEWDHTADRFWFVVRKGRPMNGTTQFTTTIVQGPGPDIDEINNRVIYVATKTLNTSIIRVTTLAYSLGAGNVLDDWEYIPVTLDTEYEDNYFNDLIDHNYNGIESSQTFIITPKEETADWEGIKDFWNSVGLTQTDDNKNVLSTTEGNGWNRKLTWTPPKNIDKTYWVGANQFIQIISNTPAGGGVNDYIGLDILVQNRVTDIPREISLSLLDMTITPRAGSFISALYQYDTGSFNKVVNYIQTDKDDLYLDETSTLDYVYEAFNLVYRKLDNRQTIPITQLKAKLSFKTFRDNREIQIPKIEGIGKFELIFDTN